MGLFSNNTFRNRLNRLDTTDISEEALSDIKNYHYETTLHTLTCCCEFKNAAVERRIIVDYSCHVYC